MTPRAALSELHLAAGPGTWRRLGFAVRADRVDLGAIRLRLDARGGASGPLTGWTLTGGAGSGDVDGLPTRWAAPAPDPDPEATVHPNGARALDHVVVATPDLDRTVRAAEAAGLGLRRLRDAGPVRQAFLRAGPGLVEAVGPAHRSPAPSQRHLGLDFSPGPARFWGLTVVVADLDLAVSRLGPEAAGRPRDAVQPGRRIVTVRPEAAAGLPLALISPETRETPKGRLGRRR